MRLEKGAENPTLLTLVCFNELCLRKNEKPVFTANRKKTEDFFNRVKREYPEEFEGMSVESLNDYLESLEASRILVIVPDRKYRTSESLTEYYKKIPPREREIFHEIAGKLYDMLAVGLEK
ncbi:MAG: hypothetical protein AABW47_00020 [Nanoarchaeota archaeon]